MEKPKSKTNVDDPLRAYTVAIVKAIESLKDAIKESKRNPLDEAADFLGEIKKTNEKLLEAAAKEIKNGEDGISITTGSVNGKGELVLVLSNGQNINVGKVRGEDGLDGEDADPIDEDALMKKILAQIPKPQEINEDALVSRIKKELPEPEKAEEIIEKIKKGKQLSYNDLKDLPDLPAIIQKYTKHLEGNGQFRNVGGATAISRMTDVDMTGIANGNTLVWNASLGRFLPGAGGGGTWGSITGTLSAQTDLQTALNAKENSIAAGTTAQYWRGDKSWQTLNKAAVGLSNVDNTTDAAKPISTATQTALDAKQATLVSGTNIKTINGSTLLGSGDLTISGGATAFTGLSDVPASYSGQALKLVRVNAGETALEFVTAGGGGDMLASTYDPANIAEQLVGLTASQSLTNKNLTGAGNTFPTFNQNTTGSAAKWTTARNLAGNSVDGSANVAFANKFIVQGTADAGLSAAQFLGALGTGIVKNTTTTGVLSIAVAGDFPTLNQNTTGSAATLTTPRTIGGVSFDGSANITVASATGGFTVSGGDLAVGANNLTITGSIGATGARATKVWTAALESTAMPTVGGVAILSSLTAPQFTTIELGHASDTTLSRVSAGLIAVEGVTLVDVSTAQTLTNKTLTTPVINGASTGTGVASAATASTLAMRDASANLLANNLLQGYTTTATAAGTTTLTVASTYIQFFTGSTTQTVTLPVASTLALGHQFLIVNNSTGLVTVNSSGANAVIILAASTSAIITCILASGTSAASWSVAYDGHGVTSGKKLSASNTLTLAGTDGTTMTFPSSSKTIAANDGSNLTIASQAVGDLLVASSTTAYGRLAAVAVGQVLASAGTGTAPAWSSAPQITTIELGHASDTTLSRASAGVMAVEGNHVPSPASQAQGDILYHNGTTWARLAAGTSGQFLKTQGASANPLWADAGGDVYAMTAKPTTYYTYTIPFFAAADATSSDDRCSGYSMSGYTAASDFNGYVAKLITTGGNSMMYCEDNSGTGTMPGTGSTVGHTFASSKKTVLSFRYKGDSTGNWFVGIGTNTNANWYTASTSSSGGHRAGFGYDGTNFRSITDNGSSVTANTITATVTNWNTFRIEFDPGSACRFYMNGTLQFTHTTNLPSTGNLFVGSGHSASGKTYYWGCPTISIEI